MPIIIGKAKKEFIKRYSLFPITFLCVSLFTGGVIFAMLTVTIDNSTISSDDIMKYREMVVFELHKMDATSQEITLLQDATVRNAIRQHRNPEDVAWAILQ